MNRRRILTAGMVVLAGGMLASVALADGDPPSPAAIEETSLRQLRTVRRVFVDRITGGETAAQMREILISSLEATNLFVLTENQERADAFLRGGSEDPGFTEVHSSSHSLNAHANLSLRSRSYTKNSSGQTTGRSLGEGESQPSAQRRPEAI